jgi:hypothetical protein
MSDTEVIDATVVDTEPATAVAVVPRLAVTPTVQAGELVARLDVIREAMRTAMQEGVDYGVIPGTGSKPTLLKPGAEKLGVLFQLDVQLANEKTFDGEHLTVSSCATVFHAPTGVRLGYGEGMCSTRERKYGKRKQERTCPACGVAAIIKGKQEYGGGWVCFKKKNGCGAKYSDGDSAIEGQTVGDIENPDLPDTWNTVVKMAEKRARVDAVLAVTGASALFTQDAEDLPHESPAPVQKPGHTELKALLRRYKVKAREIRLLVRKAGFEIADDGNVLAAVDALTDEQARVVAAELQANPVPTGGTDAPVDPKDFVHPHGTDEYGSLPFDPSVPA